MNTRVTGITNTGVVHLNVIDCASCGVIFAVTTDYADRRRSDRQTFHCPNGHNLSYGGKTDADKLRESRARETALQDQLGAAIRDAENARKMLLRDRSRVAKGVCPCCNRYFPNVHQHMSSQHPDYDHAAVDKPLTISCSCGREFDTYHGLTIHQGRSRRSGWDKPGAGRWSAHLTEVGA